MRFSIEAVNRSPLGSFASADLTASIDSLNAEMAKFKQGVYPAKVFIDIWDCVHASMYKVMDLTRQLAESSKIPTIVKAQVRASGERLIKTLVLLRTDELVYRAKLARCSPPAHACNPPLDPSVYISYVTSLSFRPLAIEVLRQAERTRATCEYIAGELPAMANLIFDINAEIDEWIADRTRKAAAALTGELDPYIDKKTEEAIANGKAEADKLIEEQRTSIWSYVIGGGVVLAGAVGLWLAFRKRSSQVDGLAGRGQSPAPLIKRVLKAKRVAKDRHAVLVHAQAYPSARGDDWCLQLDARKDSGGVTTEIWYGGKWLGCGYSEAYAKKMKREFEKGWPRKVKIGYGR